MSASTISSTMTTTTTTTTPLFWDPDRDSFYINLGDGKVTRACGYCRKRVSECVCEEEEEEGFPEEGCCGRCSGDNNKGGTELWNDLCDECDGNWGEDDEEEEEEEEEEEDRCEECGGKLVDMGVGWAEGECDCSTDDEEDE